MINKKGVKGVACGFKKEEDKVCGEIKT